ncbi:hypothetical protein FDP41_000531 [Naegleria fowleri]|uniref:Uncharacterized protein n=1 Tax=Naegleria fowleri TaxID=5763 RepID=A0A6A5CC37_NAEFO|nr:uncharacterized protein FDP41_000531 [Naegleria fowleri]KAF0984632.1 hypothetical protein FDP41_000531 [Naegleria fowleri]CAG4708641.1 unnamed protein product [Naegleria fowleri]
MKTQLVFCSAIAVLFFLCQFTLAIDVNTSLYPKLAVCKRKIEIVRELQTIRFVTKAGCIDRRNATAIGAFADLEFFASIAKFPMLGMNAKTVVTPPQSGKPITVVVGNAFGFDEVIEYRETNGKEGFQPGNDTLVRSVRLGQVNWKVDSLTRTPLNDANTSYVYQAVVSATVPNFCSIKISAMVTSDAVTFTSPKMVNRTGVVQVLNPSTLKVSMEVNGITYTADDSLVAFGTIVAFRGNRRDKPIQPSNEEKPDDATDDQTVNQFDDDVSSQLGGNNVASVPRGFFSFQNFISRWNTSAPTVITRGKFVQSPMVPFQPSQDGESTLRDRVDSNAALVRFYMAITERVDSFVWDPSTGSSEDSSYLSNSAARNGATGFVASLIVALVALIAFLF